MANLYPMRHAAVFCLFFFCATSSGFAQTVQTETPRYNTTIDQYCNGFYESLPLDYATSGKTYPLLISLAGEGEIGDGSEAELPYMLHNGPALQLSQGVFPSSITVNGNTYSFIVLAPQLNTWPAPADEPTAINDIVNYAFAHYRVDTTRVFLTGLSMGGGITWDYAGYTGATYAKRLTAILPVSGASSPSKYRAAQLAAYHVAIWATHNSGDPTVPVSYTEGYIHLLDSLNATPTPLETIFNSNQHDAWTETYNSLVQNGLNVYQWMLQYQRVGNDVVLSTGTTQPLPISLTQYGLTVENHSSVLLSWTTASEENNHYFIIQRSADGSIFHDLDSVPSAGNGGHSYTATDSHPLAGADFYRLEQVDLDGTATYFGILKASFGDSAVQALSLSPNPALSSIYVQLDNSYRGMLDVSVIDARGATLQTRIFQKQDQQWVQELGLDNLSPGTYFIRLIGDQFSATRPFIKR